MSVNFAAGLMQGLGQSKINADNKAIMDRQMALMENIVGRQGGGAAPAAGTAPAGGAWSGELGANTKALFDRYTAAGYTPEVAAGLVGNWMQESGTGINTAAVGDNGNSYGGGQWNGPRREAFFEFANQSGRKRDDLMTQADWSLHELDTTEGAARERIIAAKSPVEAARIASEAYWRPGDPQMQNRTAYAQAVYDAYGRPVPASTAVTAPDQPASPAAKVWGWMRKKQGA